MARQTQWEEQAQEAVSFSGDDTIIIARLYVRSVGEGVKAGIGRVHCAGTAPPMPSGSGTPSGTAISGGPSDPPAIVAAESLVAPAACADDWCVELGPETHLQVATQWLRPWAGRRRVLYQKDGGGSSLRAAAAARLAP